MGLSPRKICRGPYVTMCDVTKLSPSMTLLLTLPIPQSTDPPPPGDIDARDQRGGHHQRQSLRSLQWLPMCPRRVSLSDLT